MKMVNDMQFGPKILNEKLCKSIATSGVAIDVKFCSRAKPSYRSPCVLAVQFIPQAKKHGITLDGCSSSSKYHFVYFHRKLLRFTGVGCGGPGYYTIRQSGSRFTCRKGPVKSFPLFQQQSQGGFIRIQLRSPWQISKGNHGDICSLSNVALCGQVGAGND